MSNHFLVLEGEVDRLALAKQTAAALLWWNCGEKEKNMGDELSKNGSYEEKNIALTMKLSFLLGEMSSLSFL